MKKLWLLFMLLANASIAQDIVLATIDGEPVSGGEVLYAFQKNRPDSLAITFDSLDLYLDRYLNFKLKVIEARNQGIDTTQSFKNELNSYLSALKKPYTQGTDLTDQLVEQAYERLQFNIKASHLLLKMDKKAPAEDTVRAYAFLDSLKNTIKTESEFQTMAKRYSKDGSAKNGGNLGWFSVFMMVYPFETAAYETGLGQVSSVVRTEFGYHLIFVQDKIPNPGKLRTSHIFFSKQSRSKEQAKQMASQVYDSLKSGGNWDEMCRKYSEDGQTKLKGGGLPFAGLKQLPDDYLEAAFELAMNEFTPPIETDFGYHIIRLDAKQGVPELNKIRKEMEAQIVRTGRNELSNRALLAKLKAEYGFKKNEKIYSKLLAAEDLSPIERNKNEVLFSLTNRSYLVKEFIELTGTKRPTWEEIALFEQNMITAYADSIAPIQYPEYRYLRQEYEEGLLLFEIMQRSVWNKALEDSLGQRNHYEATRTKYPAPAEVSVVEIQLSTQEEIAALADSLERLDKEELINQLNNGLSMPKALNLVKRDIQQSEFASFEGFSRKRGTIFSSANKLFIVIDAMDNEFLPFEEVRGLVIADYQEKLDQEFIRALRSQHRIEKDKQALKELVNELQ